jgi:hypothetical protein
MEVKTNEPEIDISSFIDKSKIANMSESDVSQLVSGIINTKAKQANEQKARKLLADANANLSKLENQDGGLERNQDSELERNQEGGLLENLFLETDSSLNDEIKINELKINGGSDKEENNKPNLFEEINKQLSGILVKKENKSVLKGGSDKPDLFDELKKGVFNLFRTIAK